MIRNKINEGFISSFLALKTGVTLIFQSSDSHSYFNYKSDYDILNLLLPVKKNCKI